MWNETCTYVDIDPACDKVGCNVMFFCVAGIELIQFTFRLWWVSLICAKRNPALSRNNIYSPFQLPTMGRGFQFGKGDFVPKVRSQFNSLSVSNFPTFSMAILFVRRRELVVGISNFVIEATIAEIKMSGTAVLFLLFQF